MKAANKDNGLIHIKFNESPVSGTRGEAWGQTDRHDHPYVGYIFVHLSQKA